MAERSTGLPSQRQVTELLEGEFARAGFDIEDVLIDHAARPPRIKVIADGDEGLDLDSIAKLSRRASELLDDLDADSDDTPAYVLEVTSPGVDRPLTTGAHFRRAYGRRVTVTLTDGSTLAGRLGRTWGGAVALVVRDVRGELALRDLELECIAKAVVEVEFSPPNPRELEMAGQSGKEGCR
ncbi:MAG: ribosome maturation factor RimP [Mycolicibacterium sp.]|uniref:ribosome maturation factor RimP n=1 Tax=Mycolicibacterium sp. TaxID=2320850 RepID=UPI003D14A927